MIQPVNFKLLIIGATGKLTNEKFSSPKLTCKALWDNPAITNCVNNIGAYVLIQDKIKWLYQGQINISDSNIQTKQNYQALQ